MNEKDDRLFSTLVGPYLDPLAIDAAKRQAYVLKCYVEGSNPGRLPIRIGWAERLKVVDLTTEDDFVNRSRVPLARTAVNTWGDGFSVVNTESLTPVILGWIHKVNLCTMLPRNAWAREAMTRSFIPEYRDLQYAVLMNFDNLPDLPGASGAMWVAPNDVMWDINTYDYPRIDLVERVVHPPMPNLI